jgi:carbon monoxide dehydrogenase subunit G
MLKIQELETTEEGGYRVTAKIKVGPVSERFKGKVTLSDLDPPNGYKITGEGEGGAAGFAKGRAVVGFTEGRRRAADLQRGSADRRQVGVAWPAPDQWFGQEGRRRVLRQFPEGG